MLKKTFIILLIAFVGFNFYNAISVTFIDSNSAAAVGLPVNLAVIAISVLVFAFLLLKRLKRTST